MRGRFFVCLDVPPAAAQAAQVRHPKTPLLPIETVRDLLGITRALYLAWNAEGPAARERLRQLTVIGRDLREALQLARSGHGTLGYSAAWDKAERATKALGELVDEYVPMRPAVTAAAARVRRGAR
jgi:hypothetical protein